MFGQVGTSWQAEAELTSSAFPDPSFETGISEAFDGSRLVVGGFQYAYLFTSPAPGVWTPTEELDPDPACHTADFSYCSFGGDVGASNGTEIVNGSDFNARVYK